MGDPVFGIVTRLIDDEARPVITADLSTIGLIGPAPDADAATFPLDTPVEVNSSSGDTLTKLGTTGYLADAIEGINYQLANTQFAARVVIVRTAMGTDVNATKKKQQTINAIVGSSTGKTGIWAFTKCPNQLGYSPRIIIAPGYTGDMANSVDHVTQGGGGAGYVAGQSYPLTFAGGGTDAVQATGHAIGQSGGTLGPAIIDSPGAWYTTPPTCTPPTPSPGSAAAYTPFIAMGANPICAALPGVLNRLLGHAIVESLGTSQSDDNNWRETLNSTRLIPVSGGIKVFDETLGTLVMPLAPRIAGIAVRRDHEKGAPFHSWANQPIYGIVGPGREIEFDITDDANEAQELLANNIGVVVRGQVGNEFAIAGSGFVFIGTDNAGDDPLWQFYNVSRGRDYIHLTLIKSMRIYLGRYNLVGHTVEAIVNTMRNFLRNLQANENILGYKVNFAPAKNSADEIRLGHLTVGFAAEEPSVLRRITFESSRYRTAIDAMVADLAATLQLSGSVG